jgi:biotin carboxyl carrier protein
MTVRRLRVAIAGIPSVVHPTVEDAARFEVPARGEHVTELPPTADDRAEGRRRFEVVVDGWRLEATVEPAEWAELRDRARRAAAEHHAATETTLHAQIPGRVARLWVTEGEHVDQGQRLLAIEAMKMENEIRAPRAGVVGRIRVEPGGRVERNDELLTVT